MDKKAWLRQFISSFIDGPNVDALLASLADEAERMEQLSIAVNDSLTISTSSGIYLDKNYFMMTRVVSSRRAVFPATPPRIWART